MPQALIHISISTQHPLTHHICVCHLYIVSRFFLSSYLQEECSRLWDYAQRWTEYVILCITTKECLNFAKMNVEKLEWSLMQLWGFGSEYLFRFSSVVTSLSRGEQKAKPNFSLIHVQLVMQVWFRFCIRRNHRRLEIWTEIMGCWACVLSMGIMGNVA